MWQCKCENCIFYGVFCFSDAIAQSDGVAVDYDDFGAYSFLANFKMAKISKFMWAMRGGITSFQTTDSSGKIITREKDVNVLLHEDTIVNFISNDDLFFLKFLLVEKGGYNCGYNLRNQVAHAFLRSPQQYSIAHMNLLILAILKCF